MFLRLERLKATASPHETFCDKFRSGTDIKTLLKKAGTTTPQKVRYFLDFFRIVPTFHENFFELSARTTKSLQVGTFSIAALIFFFVFYLIVVNGVLC